MGKSSGVSKWFSRLKGYGYINPDDDGYDANRNDLDVNDDDYHDYYDRDYGKDDSKVKNRGSRRK